MSYKLISWRQGLDTTNAAFDVIISTEGKPGKFKVETEENKMRISLNGEQVLAWKLFDAVLSNPEWETKDSELHVSLMKKSPEGWKSLLRNPLPEDMPVFLSATDLDALLRTDVRPFPAPVTDEAQLDALLDDVLDNKNVPEEASAGLSMEAEELKHLKTEQEGIAARLAELTAMPEPKDDNTKKRIAAVTRMAECCSRIETIRRGPVTCPALIEVLRLDILKAKLNRGEAPEESEDFSSPEETQMSADSLYINGILALEQRDGAKGLHYLRLAALCKGHTQSTMTLVRLYMESGQQTKSLQLLLNKAMEEMEPLSNFTTAQMFDNGVAHFMPCMALALYFYQRAASCGETSAMCFAAQLYLRGGTIVGKNAKEQIDTKRAQLWLSHALERGSTLGYKMMLELQLTGTSLDGKKASYADAKRFHSMLSETSRDLLKTIPNADAQLEALRGGSSPVTQDRRATTTSSPAAPSGTTTRPDTSSNVRSNAEERLKAFGAGGASDARVGMSLKTSKEQSASDSLRRSWERRTVLGVVLGSVYVLAFPIRVAAMPMFFGLVSGVLQIFGRGGPSSSASAPRGGMF